MHGEAAVKGVACRLIDLSKDRSEINGLASAFEAIAAPVRAFRPRRESWSREVPELGAEMAQLLLSS